jgi:hypothetical protein
MMNIILKPDHSSLTFQIIRPWKSRLALLYVKKGDFLIDLALILLTVVAIFSRPLALQGLQKVLKKLGADDRLPGARNWSGYFINTAGISWKRLSR